MLACYPAIQIAEITNKDKEANRNFQVQRRMEL